MHSRLDPPERIVVQHFHVWTTLYPKYTWRELVELYGLTQPARNLEPRYNVAPTTTIDAVRDRARELVPMRWGLVPSWWKKTLKDVPATFNARGETVAEKSMFRSAFKNCGIGLPRVANDQQREAALLLQRF